MKLTPVIRNGELVYVSKVLPTDKVLKGPNKKIPAMMNKHLKNYEKK